jgi:hypothetical protein
LSARLPTNSGNRDNKSRTGDLIKSSIEVAISGEKSDCGRGGGGGEKDAAGEKSSLRREGVVRAIKQLPVLMDLGDVGRSASQNQDWTAKIPSNLLLLSDLLRKKYSCSATKKPAA